MNNDLEQRFIDACASNNLVAAKLALRALQERIRKSILVQALNKATTSEITRWLIAIDPMTVNQAVSVLFINACRVHNYDVAHQLLSASPNLIRYKSSSMYVATFIEHACNNTNIDI